MIELNKFDIENDYEEPNEFWFNWKSKIVCYSNEQLKEIFDQELLRSYIDELHCRVIAVKVDLEYLDFKDSKKFRVLGLLKIYKMSLYMAIKRLKN